MLRNLFVVLSLVSTTLVTMSFAPTVYADDAVYLKENAKLVVSNRAKALDILKMLGVPVSTAKPTGGATLLDVNQQYFILNQMTFKQIAAKVGADSVDTPIPTEDKLVDQNHTILMGNGMVCKSIAAKLGIEFMAPEAGATVLETNNKILKANAVLLEKVAAKVKK